MMPSRLTSNFHSVVEISEELLQRVFLRKYFTGEFPGYPDRITGNLEMPATGSYAVEVLIPSLTLLNSTPDIPAGVRVTLPLAGSVIITQSPFNYIGSISLELAELRVYAPLLLDPRTKTVSIDLATAQFIANVDNLPIDELLKLFLKTKIEAVAKSELMSRPAPSFEFSVGRSRIREIRTITSGVQTNHAFLALFIDFSARLPDPGDATEVVSFREANDDVAIAISSDGFNTKLEREIYNRFGQILPAPFPDDDSMILNNVELTLHNGYIRISGSVKTDIFHISSDVGFSAEVHFYPEDGFKPHLESINTDLPDWFDAFNLIPWFGTVLWLLGKDMAATSVAGSGITDGFGGITSNELGDFRSFVSGIDITPEGMVIHRWMRLSTFVGNRSSKELHVFNDYRWITKMSARNFLEFEHYETAIREGYNGCRYCLRQLDTG